MLDVTKCSIALDNNAGQHNENSTELCRQLLNCDGSPLAMVQQGVQDLLDPLIKAACSARGKRNCQDAPGTVLAAAVQALSEAQDCGTSDDARAACAGITAQLASLLAQGTLSCDVAGSFQALQAAWKHQHWSCMPSAKAARNSLQAIVKTLAARRHWTVRGFYGAWCSSHLNEEA